MKTNFLKLFTLGLILTTMFSCIKDKQDVTLVYYTPEDYEVLKQTLNLPEKPHDYSLTTAFNNFGPPSFNNDAKATLGRVLFYDKQLSANNKVSCASCHDQKRAFADPISFSKGFEGKATLRNSFALGGVATFSDAYGDGNSFNNGGAFFWDNRASTVAEQSRQTLQDPIEMGMDLHVLPQKINVEPHYQILANKAFGTTSLDEHMILDAISSFVNSFSTTKSKFDKGFATTGNSSELFSNYSDQENNGKSIYMNNCASCHGFDNMARTNMPFANNGLDMVYKDKGVGAITKNPADDGKFKIPLLRNIALTGPYMHDGRFETLEEVIEHYNTGIKQHRNLNRDLLAPKMNLTQEDKDALIAFLNTLTDHEFIKEVKYSDPFLK